MCICICVWCSYVSISVSVCPYVRVCMCVCMCVRAWMHMHVCSSAYGGLRLILRIFLSYFSTLFIEAKSLNQNQSSSMWAALLASLLQDDLSLPSEARVTSKPTCQPWNLSGFWVSNSSPSPCLASTLTTKSPLQPTGHLYIGVLFCYLMFTRCNNSFKF